MSRIQHSLKSGTQGATAAGSGPGAEGVGLADYPIRPIPFNQVRLGDDFWAPRIRLNHERTIPFAFRQSEE